MTVRDEGFFHALQQDPNDDITRLVYADSLEDRGDEESCARAELIRVQVELAAPAPLTRWAADRAEELVARQDALLARWERVWLGDWAEVLDGWTFRRGLVEAVSADATLFLEHAPEWFAEWPTLSVAKLTRAAGHLGELASFPWLAHLRGLDLSDNDINAETLAQLTASRFLCLLQALDLSGNPIGLRGAGLIGLAPHTGELTELHLARCGLGNGWLQEWFVGRARQWRRLDLSGNYLFRRDLVALVNSPLMPNLLSLDLAMNPLGEQGASVLADCPNAAGLIDLGLCDTGTGNVELAALASSPNLKSLRSLDLRGHRCWIRLDRRGEDQGGLGELARSPLLGQLRRLLLAVPGPSNGWTAEVISLCRPHQRRAVVPNCSTAAVLRRSPYLIPSQLTECDLEELWWLGDTRGRERLPSLWTE